MRFDFQTELDKAVETIRRVQTMEKARATKEQLREVEHSQIKQVGSKYDAIIAVSDEGESMLVSTLTTVPWKIEASREYNTIGDITFDVPPGLYYANCYPEYCAFETEICWELMEPICTIREKKDCASLACCCLLPRK